MHVELGLLQQADRLQVALDDIAQFRNGRGHEFAARLPIAALRIEHRLELVDQERGVAALAEYRGNNPRQRHDPLEMIEVLRIDEHLEGPPLFMRRAFVQNDVVDGDVHRVIGDRRLYLIGRADQDFGALELLVHPDDVVLSLERRCRRRGFLRLRFLHAVLRDLLADFDMSHDQNFP
jgi:hypothetical protein